MENSDQVIGRSSVDGLTGWRDDFPGHAWSMRRSELCSVEVGSSLVGMGAALAASPAVANKALKAACSFSGDTQVLMADGSHVAFSDLEVGDLVWSSDPDSGESGARSVVGLWPHFDALVEFGVGDGVVVTTEDHPFWNATDLEWQGPVEFDHGDLVLTASGELVATDGLDWATVEGGVAWDMTVEGLHTFYVRAGDVDVLVHNCDLAPSGAPDDSLALARNQRNDLADEMGSMAQVRSLALSIPTTRTLL